MITSVNDRIISGKHVPLTIRLLESVRDEIGLMCMVESRNRKLEFIGDLRISMSSYRFSC